MVSDAQKKVYVLDGNVPILVNRTTMEEKMCIRDRDGGSWNGYTFVRKATMPNIDGDITFKATISIAPVSYTHLDVYKRQEVMGLQGRYIYWAAGTAGGAIAGFIACLLYTSLDIHSLPLPLYTTRYKQRCLSSCLI